MVGNPILGNLQQCPTYHLLTTVPSSRRPSTSGTRRTLEPNPTAMATSPVGRALCGSVGSSSSSSSTEGGYSPPKTHSSNPELLCKTWRVYSKPRVYSSNPEVLCKTSKIHSSNSKLKQPKQWHNWSLCRIWFNSLHVAVIRVILIMMLIDTVWSQTYSSCNPLQRTCPANRALGMSIKVDFTEGSVNSFAASGSPTYDSDGVSFTVAKSRDSPQLVSTFYIMFGRVEVTMKAAPGQGIVSSVVLQSDTLDEIDYEWLGGKPAEVQTNYFGKGILGTYNRGRFHDNPDNQVEWHTYVVDWDPERILFIIDGVEIRTLTAEEAGDEYPQSPMQFKFGAWAGGDSGNPQGTIDWAGGVTDYSKGPFTMKVKSVTVSDYSTGRQYKYTDNSGSWQSIEAIDGKVNGNVGNVDSVKVTATAAAEAPSPTSPPDHQMPPGGIGPATQTGWPFVPGATPDPGDVPDGWTMTEEGKLIPSNSLRLEVPVLLMVASLFAGMLLRIG